MKTKIYLLIKEWQVADHYRQSVEEFETFEEARDEIKKDKKLFKYDTGPDYEIYEAIELNILLPYPSQLHIEDLKSKEKK